MKKILIVNDLLLGGGVEKLMFDLVKEWHSKYRITILTDNYDERFYDIYPENVHYWTVHKKQKEKESIITRMVRKVANKINPNCRDENRIVQKVNREQFDILITIKEGWKMLDSVHYKAKEKYVWVHTDYASYYYTDTIFGNKQNELDVFTQFKKVVCVSEQIKKSLISVIGNPENLIVKYNPIDVDNILEKSKEPVVDIDREIDKPLFVSVGRINYQKGYPLLLEACHMLEKDGYDFKVLIVGEREPWGDEHVRCSQTASRLGVRNVEFIGGRKNPYKYMKMADWFISSSLFEGYSLVSQEAAVLDIPLLLTDCSGVRELVGDNEFGLIMEPSVLGIYTGIKNVLEHKELQQKYKERIRERKKIINYTERIRDIEKIWTNR